MGRHPTGTRLVIELGSPSPLDRLTAGAAPHLKDRLEHMAIQVLKEVSSIEAAEHVGSGPAEITAAHIDRLGGSHGAGFAARGIQCPGGWRE